MSYILIPFGLIAVFVVYVLYLLMIKKDMIKFKAVVIPGLFFIVVWLVLYYFMLR